MTRLTAALSFLALLNLDPPARASGHGPVFGLATPTNPRGGWSLDLSLMGRGASGLMFRPAIGYGLTENLKISLSAPVVFKTEPFVPSRLSGFNSMAGDFEATALWRVHRQDTGIGSRVESALIGGLIAPGPQSPGGGLGALLGGVTGIASRAHYAWAGATYQRYSSTRPDLLFYSLAYAYRPPSWRTDSGWDWRIFAECTGERQHHPQSHQLFLGPTTLGVYKNYAVSAGIQFPLFQSTPPSAPRERFRAALNLAYFF